MATYQHKGIISLLVQLCLPLIVGSNYSVVSHNHQKIIILINHNSMVVIKIMEMVPEEYNSGNGKIGKHFIFISSFCLSRIRPQALSGYIMQKCGES